LAVPKVFFLFSCRSCFFVSWSWSCADFSGPRVLNWFSPSALKEFPSCSFLRSIRPDFLCSAPFSTREFSDCRAPVDFPPSLLRLDFCRIPLHGLALTRSICLIHRDRAGRFQFLLPACGAVFVSILRLRQVSTASHLARFPAPARISFCAPDKALHLLPQFGQVQASVLCPEAKGSFCILCLTAQRLCFLRFRWTEIWIVAGTYSGYIFELLDQNVRVFLV
jgi:hypothetical protein